MIKVLITDNNSTWGVIVNPQTDNTYSDVVNFPDPSKKNEFIANELFGGNINWKNRFVEPIGRSIFNELDATFAIALSDYPDETMDTMLNKDYAIAQFTGNDDKVIYKYYQINASSKDNENLITYSCELDIFLTYKLGFKNDIKLLRSHADRFDPLTKNWIRGQKFSPLLNEEPIDSMFSQRVFTEQIKLVNDYKGTVDALKLLSEVKWTVFYFSATDATDVPVGQFQYYLGLDTVTNQKDVNQQIRLPYITVIVPDQDIWYKDTGGSRVRLTRLQDIYDDWKDSVHILGITAVDFPVMLQKDEIDWSIDTDDLLATLTISDSDFDVRGDSADGILFKADTSPTPIRIMLIESLDKEFTAEVRAQDDYIYPNGPDLILVNPSEISNLSWEPKMECYPYTSYSLVGLDNTRYEMHHTLLGASPKFIRIFNTSPEEHQVIVYPISGEYNEFMGDTGNPTMGYGYSRTTSYLFAESTDAYKEYSKTHQSGIELAKVSLLPKVALGAVATVGMAGKAGVAAGALTGATSAMLIAGSYSKYGDVKNTPDSTTIGTGSLSSDLSYADISPILVKERAIEQSLKIAFDFFLQKGYTINRLTKGNYALENRYYYNHIETEDVFYNLEIQQEVDGVYEQVDVSANIKKMFAVSCMNALTLWHYRDSSTWRGIKNFDLDNTEMWVIDENKWVPGPIELPPQTIFVAQFERWKVSPYSYSGRTYLDCENAFPEFDIFNTEFCTVQATTDNACNDASWQTIYESAYGNDAIWRPDNYYEITFDNLFGVDMDEVTVGLDRARNSSSSGDRAIRLYFTPASSGVETLVFDSGNLVAALTNYKLDLIQALIDAGLEGVVVEGDKLKLENNNTTHCGMYIGVKSVS